jgi:hypothetical protein
MYSLIMDIVIAALLGATIFYAIRLSNYLDHFRETREDLNRVITDLSSHVTKAQSAVEELRAHAGQSAVRLQELTSRAEEIADELQLVTAAGDALAGRLEGLAGKANGAAGNKVQADLPEPLSAPAKTSAKVAATDKPFRSADRVAGPAFSIRDREYEDDDAQSAAEEDENWDEEDPVLSGLSSQAERDLAQVLRRRRGQG